MTEIWLHLQAFFDILSTRNVLIEVGVLAVCVLLGGLVAAVLLRERNRAPRKSRPPTALSWRYFGTRRATWWSTPVIVVLGSGACSRAASLLAAHFDVTMLGRRGAPDRRVHRGARRRAAVRRQPRQQVLDAELGEPGDAAHLAGVRRRIPGLARSDHLPLWTASASPPARAASRSGRC